MKYIFNKKIISRLNTSSRLSRSGGFSLIELLVSMALLGILGGIGVSIFAVINNAYDQANALSKMQTQGSQVMEVLQRSIRGAVSVETRSHASGCAYDECLVIGVPSSSIEYQINGQCELTVYGWNAPTASVNGKIVRYYLDNGNVACNGSVPIELFDGHPRNGVSVEKRGSNSIFSVNTGSDGIDSVSINMRLTEGVQIKVAKANVPLTTRVSLRNY